MKNEFIPHTDVIPKVISLKLFLDHVGLKKSQEGLEIVNPCDAKFAHVDNASLVTRSFIFHENIHATRVGTLSAGELGSISKRDYFRNNKAYMGDWLSYPSFSQFWFFCFFPANLRRYHSL